jgi:hypothetical protein
MRIEALALKARVEAKKKQAQADKDKAAKAGDTKHQRPKSTARPQPPQ